jgi:hypothetical protein
MLVSEGVRMIERASRQAPEHPFAGIRWALLAGACLVSGVLTLVTDGPRALWVTLFALAVVFALRKSP